MKFANRRRRRRRCGFLTRRKRPPRDRSDRLFFRPVNSFDLWPESRNQPPPPALCALVTRNLHRGILAFKRVAGGTDVGRRRRRRRAKKCIRGGAHILLAVAPRPARPDGRGTRGRRRRLGIFDKRPSARFGEWLLSSSSSLLLLVLCRNCVTLAVR